MLSMRALKGAPCDSSYQCTAPPETVAAANDQVGTRGATSAGGGVLAASAGGAERATALGLTAGLAAGLLDVCAGALAAVDSPAKAWVKNSSQLTRPSRSTRA